MKPIKITPMQKIDRMFLPSYYYFEVTLEDLSYSLKKFAKQTLKILSLFQEIQLLYILGSGVNLLKLLYDNEIKHGNITNETIYLDSAN